MNCSTIFNLWLVLAMWLTCASTSLLAGDAPPPVRVIFDTDMSGDCDDAGALAILNAFADNGEAEILACVVNGHDKDKAAAASIDAINSYYGRPHLPIGTYQGPLFPPTKSRYTAKLRDEFSHDGLPDDQRPKAVDVYRAALATAPENSVVIVSVGYLINLADLLQSPPDDHSPLGGTELVQRKVKQLVVMGGAFPRCAPGKGEYNFAGLGGGPVTIAAIDHWPTPILFSGREIGAHIITGAKLASTRASNPVRRAYELHGSTNGGESYDLTAVLAAVRAPEKYWSVRSGGYCHVYPDGSDEWLQQPDHHHSYLAPGVPLAEIVNVLDDALIQLPKIHQ